MKEENKLKLDSVLVKMLTTLPEHDISLLLELLEEKDRYYETLHLYIEHYLNKKTTG